MIRHCQNCQLCVPKIDYDLSESFKKCISNQKSKSDQKFTEDSLSERIIILKNPNITYDFEKSFKKSKSKSKQKYINPTRNILIYTLK